MTEKDILRIAEILDKSSERDARTLANKARKLAERKYSGRIDSIVNLNSFPAVILWDDDDLANSIERITGTVPTDDDIRRLAGSGRTVEDLSTERGWEVWDSLAETMKK